MSSGQGSSSDPYIPQYRQQFKEDSNTNREARSVYDDSIKKVQRTLFDRTSHLKEKLSNKDNVLQDLHEQFSHGFINDNEYFLRMNQFEKYEKLLLKEENAAKRNLNQLKYDLQSRSVMDFQRIELGYSKLPEVLYEKIWKHAYENAHEEERKANKTNEKIVHLEKYIKIYKSKINQLDEQQDEDTYSPMITRQVSSYERLVKDAELKLVALQNEEEQRLQKIKNFPAQ